MCLLLMNMIVINKQKLLGSGIDPDLHLNIWVLDLQAKVGSSGGRTKAEKEAHFLLE